MNSLNVVLSQEEVRAALAEAVAQKLGTGHDLAVNLVKNAKTGAGLDGDFLVFVDILPPAEAKPA